MNRIITINRTFGSGGREVGKRLADSLKTAYYDKELLAKIAKETGLAEVYIKHYDESATRTFQFTFGRSIPFYRQSPTEKIQIAVAKIMKEVAEKGDAVFIGRCSNYILRDSSPFKIFIYASDMNFRVSRCFDKVPLDKDKGETNMIKEILTVDKKRAKYHELYTGQNCHDMENYNLCIDTSKFGIKGTVDIILKALA